MPASSVEIGSSTDQVQGTSTGKSKKKTRKRRQRLNYRSGQAKKKKDFSQNYSVSGDENHEKPPDNVSGVDQNESSKDDAGAATTQSTNVSTQKLFEKQHQPKGIQLSHNHFLQQQITLLSTKFSFEDCNQFLQRPSRGRKEAKSHIPRSVIEDTIRKVNHKMDDEIQRHLNRQNQRKIINELLYVEKQLPESSCEEDNTIIKETMSISQILRTCPEKWDLKDDKTNRSLVSKYTNLLTNLKQTNNELNDIDRQVASCESLSQSICEVESLANEVNATALRKDLIKTNKLVCQVVDILRKEEP